MKNEIGIGQSSTMLMQLDELISFLQNGLKDVDGNVAVVTTVKSGGYENPTFMQTITLCEVLDV